MTLGTAIDKFKEMLDTVKAARGLEDIEDSDAIACLTAITRLSAEMIGLVAHLARAEDHAEECRIETGRELIGLHSRMCYQVTVLVGALVVVDDEGGMEEAGAPAATTLVS